MTDRTRSPGTRSIGQTFLVGPHLYLRPVELSDAATAAIWRNAPFPAPTEVVEQELKDRFSRGMYVEENNQLMIACRKSDDVPVGSVEMSMGGWRFIRFECTIDPLAPESRRDAILAELLRILVPWTIGERNVMTLVVPILDNQPQTSQVVAELDGRFASRLRERYLIDGGRRDKHTVQFFNPVWIDKLGAPPAFGEEPVERIVRSPAKPRQFLPDRDHLPGAVAVGERVYLRPHVEGDSQSIAEWSMRESEVVFPEGRWPVNAASLECTIQDSSKTEPSEKIGLAVVLRESHELIGVMVVFGIDWVHRNGETASELFRAEHRSGGYGTEAKHLMLDYVFDTLGLHMVTSYVSEMNPRSAAALRKQGYRFAGYTAWESFVSSGLCGTWAFDLLADEWRAARRAGEIR